MLGGPRFAHTYGNSFPIDYAGRGRNTPPQDSEHPCRARRAHGKKEPDADNVDRVSFLEQYVPILPEEKRNGSVAWR